MGFDRHQGAGQNVLPGVGFLGQVAFQQPLLDGEGARSGYDLELVRAVPSAVQLPVIASGGAATPGDLAEAFEAGAGAAASWQGADLNALEPEEMEALLADTVLKEFKLRLERIGLEYQTPARP